MMSLFMSSKMTLSFTESSQLLIRKAFCSLHSSFFKYVHKFGAFECKFALKSIGFHAFGSLQDFAFFHTFHSFLEHLLMRVFFNLLIFYDGIFFVDLQNFFAYFGNSFSSFKTSTLTTSHMLCHRKGYSVRPTVAKIFS